MPHGHISRVRAVVRTHGMPSGAFLGQPISTALMVKLNMVGLQCHKANQSMLQNSHKIVSLTTRLAAFVARESNHYVHHSRWAFVCKLWSNFKLDSSYSLHFILYVHLFYIQTKNYFISWWSMIGIYLKINLFWITLQQVTRAGS